MAERKKTYHQDVSQTTRIRIAVILVLIFAVLIGIDRTLRALDYQDAAQSILYVLMATSFSMLATVVVARVASGRLTRTYNREVRVSPAFFTRFHQWRQMPTDLAQAAWASVGHVPAGGTLRTGWACDDCDTTCLEVEGTDSQPTVILQGFVKEPWLEWMGGLFLLSSGRVLGEKPTIRPRLLLRICRWAEADDSHELAATSGLAVHGEVTTVNAWTCRDCGAYRIDCTDGEGRDFLVITNTDGYANLPWAAGIYVGFGKAPILASDRMNASWDASPTTSSSP